MSEEQVARVYAGALLGALLVILFSALAIRAVGKAAFYVIRGTSRPHVVHIGRRMRYRVEERTP